VSNQSPTPHSLAILTTFSGATSRGDATTRRQRHHETVPNTNDHPRTKTTAHLQQ
jgi:hypothetical protein